MAEAACRVTVIGAGAAGLVAAAEAAERGASVLLIEKNAKTGVKILMSGGTRCNLTHQTDAQGIAQAFGHARRFLQPSLGAFPPEAVVRMFEDLGVATKVESTGKIFPASDRALHVRDALLRRATDAGVRILTGAAVRAIGTAPRSSPHGSSPHGPLSRTAAWYVRTDNEQIEADRLIVTAGGKSWPGCGTTGDAYAWLRSLGHTIVPPRPALVPLTGGEAWTRELSGVTLEDCVASVVPAVGSKRKPLARRRSSLLFTHFGFSGPAAMDISGVVTAAASLAELSVLVDLIPDCDEAQLRQALTDRADAGGRQRVQSILSNWLPNRLAAAIVQQAGADCTVAQLPRRACSGLIEQLKRMPIHVTGTLGFDKAEVTAGGVDLKEVDPRTLESRLHSGLYIAGEVLDVDGPIGGYNFQAAFSTGRAAGIAAAG